MADYTVSQFDTSQYHQAYNVLSAICGPNVAEAFSRFYGMNTFSPDQIVNLAKEAGLWSANAGMFGPQAEKTLLDRLGIPVDFSPQINLNDLQSKLQQGMTAAISTPGHYFFLQGYDPTTGQYDTGNTGTAYRTGSRYLTMDQMAALGGGQPSGMFVSQSGAGSNPQTGPTANAAQVNANDQQSVTNYIRMAAQARGINPDIAVAVANSEGLNQYVGDNNSSFGPFQLHYGGVAGGGNAVSGLGDAFTKATGLDARNPSTIAAQIDWSLDQVAQSGWSPWHGAAGLGITGMMGVGPNAKAVGSYSPQSQNAPTQSPQQAAPADWFSQAFGWLKQNNPQLAAMINPNPMSGAVAPQYAPFAGQSPMQGSSMFPQISPYGPPNFSLFGNAPSAQPNIMSRMSRPMSLYG